MSFPQSFADNQDATEKIEHWLTDFDTLPNATSSEVDRIYWAAPRWMTRGDILFFYFAKSSKINIRKRTRSLDEESQATGLLRKLLAGRREQRLRSLLNQAADRSEKDSGTIFACAEATGPAEFISPEKWYSSRFIREVESRE